MATHELDPKIFAIGSGILSGTAVYTLARLLGLSKKLSLGAAIPGVLAGGYGGQKLLKSFQNKAPVAADSETGKQFAESALRAQELASSMKGGGGKRLFSKDLAGIKDYLPLVFQKVIQGKSKSIDGYKIQAGKTADADDFSLHVYPDKDYIGERYRVTKTGIKKYQQ